MKRRRNDGNSDRIHDMNQNKHRPYFIEQKKLTTSFDNHKLPNNHKLSNGDKKEVLLCSHYSFNNHKPPNN